MTNLERLTSEDLRSETADLTPSPTRPRVKACLKFKRQGAVRWFAPAVLGRTGLRTLISSAIGQFLDKREMQAASSPVPIIHRLGIADGVNHQATKAERSAGSSSEPGNERPDTRIATSEGIWIDFIADTGDGFAATYTIAWLAAQEHLDVCGKRLHRADLVVLGGDEVYPAGDIDAYENRFTGPFEASLPWLASRRPHLFAIPGNHDWYDGLTSFTRVFCQQKPVGARKTHQTRSYFAVELPNRWWVWGIDIQFDSYIDEPQLRYFKSVDLRAGDRIILCTATPSWVDGPESRGFKNLQYFEKEVIHPAGATVPLTLSGDSHHYAHLEGGGSHKITAGGGGAFLHPTHTLPKGPITLPTAEGGQQSFQETTCYPKRRSSRWLAAAAVGLPIRNWTFMFVPAIVYLLLGWSSQFSIRAFDQAADLGPTTELAADGAAAPLDRYEKTPDLDATARRAGWTEVLSGLFRNTVSVLILVVFGAAMITFAKPKPRRGTLAKVLTPLVKGLMGTVHLSMHLAAVVFVATAAAEFALGLFDRGFWFVALLAGTTFVLGGVVGSLVTGLYLAVTCLFGAHGNEAFSAMRLTGYKNFLRLHLEGEGDVRLTVYPIGVKKAVSKWELDPQGQDYAPWLKPQQGKAIPFPEFMEDPFSVT